MPCAHERREEPVDAPFDPNAEEHRTDADMREERAQIDESEYGGSSSESGGDYSNEGPTVANVSGDTMGEAEEAVEGGEPPEGRVADVGDVHRSGG
jgi:hypothetical protein